MSKFDEIYPLFQEYDMFSQTIEFLKEPNVYKVMTPYGSYVCKRTSAPPGRLKMIGGVLRHLSQRGWEGAVPFTYTKYDEPFVRRKDSLYYVTNWVPSVEFEPDLLDSWAKAVATRLAELHHFTQNYRFDDPRQVEPLVDALLSRWKHWVGQVKENAETAKVREYPSPFDVVFLANQSFILDMAETAIRLLSEWKERHRTRSHFRLAIIHGYPHPAHTLLDRSGQVRLINFDRAVFDTPIRDLALLYRTYFHFGGVGSTAYDLFACYTEVFPLRPEEIKLLAAFLTYPERVMRDMQAYYGGRRKWNELYAVKRLEKDIDRLMSLSRWINRAF